MPARWSILLPILLLLGGCSSSRQVWVAPPYRTSFAWDGLGRDPNARRIRHPQQRAQVAKEAIPEMDRREAALAALPEYSREWVSLRKELDAAEDARITNILAICKGC